MSRLSLLLVMTLAVCLSQAQQPVKPRIIISSDIGGTDPDDNQSVAHLLMYSNEFDLEGLVSSPSFGDGHKGEILRMIDVYEKDLPTLNKHISGLMTPEQLRPLVKQGRQSEAPACGYGEPTEGSEWIVRQARKQDDRPLYILVWGCLEDVAQALHDAPDIAPKLRVYWIGGPNKKWGVNAYCYIVEHFPNLWMIENNTTYRGFIYDSKNTDEWNAGFFEKHIKDAGNLGRDFAAYYKGNPKLGDTPSLLYLMKGNPENPEAQSWGGKFVRTTHTPRTIFYGATTAKDTAQICSIIEWQLKGPKRKDIAIDSSCITLDIRKQQWKGYYKGNGLYVLRHSTYYTGTLDYTITSTVKGFKPIKGQITVENTWNKPQKDTDLQVGAHWWTDSYAPADSWHNCAGANNQLKVRKEIMRDWARRWSWLKPTVKPSAQQGREKYEFMRNLPVYADSLIADLTYPLAWGNSNSKDFDQWKREARQKVFDCMLTPPPPPADGYDVKVLAEEQRDGYRARKIEIRLSRYYTVPAYVLIPDGKGPFPAVNALHDHGAHLYIGKEKMIRPLACEDSTVISDAEAWSVGYEGQFFGDYLAKNGYVVFSADAPMWGERGQKEGPLRDRYDMIAGNMMMYGTDLSAYMTYDDIAGTEYLAQMPEVDASRIGCTGWSMGAYRAWMLSALSDRIKVGAAVCWMVTTDEQMGFKYSRTENGGFANCFPGLRRWLDYPHVASIACPKPMLFINGSQDKLFPVPGVKKAFNIMHDTWKSQHADDKLETELWDMPHSCGKRSQQRVLEFFKKHL